MDTLVFVVVLALLAMVAVWFLQNHRARVRTAERKHMVHGVPADDFGRERGSRTTGPRIAACPYPTLAFIEQALGRSPGILTTAGNAGVLEVRASELVAAFWSDVVWTTGIVSGRALDQVLAELVPSNRSAPVRRADVLIPAERENARVALVA